MNILFPLLIVIKCSRDHPELENAGHGSELGCVVLERAYFGSFIFQGYVKFWEFYLSTSVVCEQAKKDGKASSTC